MKNTVSIISIIILSVLLVGIAYISQNESLCCKYEMCKQLTTICDYQEEEIEKEEKIGGEVLSEKGQKIYLENIKSGDTIDMGSEIKGEVSGNWFFEGSFPVRVLNIQGEVVSTFVATTYDDWMNETTVPFSVIIDFPLEQEGAYVLQFEKSNPSGLDDNSDTAKIAISIKPLEQKVETMKVKVFFSSTKLNEDMIDCSLVFPVTREIEKSVAVGRASLTELFKGTTPLEEEDKYFTNIPDGVVINSLDITDGVAKVDLNSKLEEGVGGSCRVTAIRAQITETLKQFPTVDSVIISIDGQTEDILQP
ncbi:MAG TPA: GerMN domain-containing protein [Candidatus Dojkabacteria bacterium]|nr:GerMN domain-containing protein [Candidatus Dojkabacteria bacterium]